MQSVHAHGVWISLHAMRMTSLFSEDFHFAVHTETERFRIVLEWTQGKAHLDVSVSKRKRISVNGALDYEQSLMFSRDCTVQAKQTNMRENCPPTTRGNAKRGGIAARSRVSLISLSVMIN